MRLNLILIVSEDLCYSLVRMAMHIMKVQYDALRIQLALRLSKPSHHCIGHTLPHIKCRFSHR